MCGVAAIFSKDQPVNVQSILNALISLNHRGPDASGYHIGLNYNVVLAHTRLSIIGVENGAQPIVNDAKDYAVSVNGEFYGYEIIKKEYQNKGYRFKTQSDSEIVLPLYEHYGMDCLSHLRGEFAFCLWDEKQQCLYAARDRFGIKPLYYCEYENKIYIASEIKAILAAGVPAQWDMGSYFNRSFFFTDKTLFKGIKSVPPGHYLKVNSSGVSLHAYWDLNYETTNINNAFDFNENVDRVRAALLEATQLRMRSDVSLGVYLSGGIDSSAILGLANQFSNNALNTFTIGFEDKEYDESNRASISAEYNNAKHLHLSVRHNDLADNFNEAIWHSETPCMNAHGVAKYLLSRFVQRKGIRVVLTGEGADELFAGYPCFRQDLFNQQSVSDQQRQRFYASNKMLEGVNFLTEKKSQNEELLTMFGFEPSWITPLLAIQQTLSGLYCESNQFFDTSVSKAFSLHLKHIAFKRMNPVHASMYASTRSGLPNYILANLGDRMEMAHSIEGRTPFLDHKLAELLCTIPVEHKLNFDTDKRLMRYAVRPYVHKNIYCTPKQAFTAPPAVNHTSSKLYEMARDTLTEARLRSLPFFSYAKVNAFMAGLENKNQIKNAAQEAVMMELLSLCAMQTLFSLSD